MYNVIVRHPIIAYIVMVMIWSWGLWSLLFTVVKPGSLLHNAPPLSYLYIVLGGIGPSIIGLILTKTVDGKSGVTSLKRQLCNWRVGWWWLSICLIPLLTFIPVIIRTCFGLSNNLDNLSKLIIPGLILGISAGLMEEFGWRGFLLPRLLKKISPIRSTLILGLIWGGLWHGYADYFGLGNNWILIFLLGPVLLSAWSFVLTWVYLHTQGSLLLSILIHASISSSALIFGQTYQSTHEELIWTLVNVGIAVITAMIIGIFGLNKLSLIQHNVMSK